MILRLLHAIMMLAVPMMMFSLGPGRTRSVFKPDIPDTLDGIHIRFEVKQTQITYQGRTVSIYCLCSEITNQNAWPETILVIYQCQDQPREKVLEIGGNQQKMILIDKCLLAEKVSRDASGYYSLVKLEHR